MKTQIFLVILMLKLNSSYAGLATLTTKFIKAIEVAKVAPEAGAATKSAGALEAEQAARKSVKAAESEKLVTPSALDARPILDDGLSAKNKLDIDEYKRLKSIADKGDSESMMKLASMVDAKTVVDLKLQFFDFWVFQAAHHGNKMAISRIKKDCAESPIRKQDKIFEEKCKEN
jgi:N-acetylglucosamine kinase-like BadF-type ATPase